MGFRCETIGIQLVKRESNRVCNYLTHIPSFHPCLFPIPHPIASANYPHNLPTQSPTPSPHSTDRICPPSSFPIRFQPLSPPSLDNPFSSADVAWTAGFLQHRGFCSRFQNLHARVSVKLPCMRSSTFPQGKRVNFTGMYKQNWD